MNSTKAPGLALWMLKNCACGPCTEELTGDLLERYAQEQNRFWFWREVFTTIIRGCAEEALTHKGLMLRAMLSGWGGILLFRGMILEFVSDDIYHRLYPSLADDRLPPHWAFAHPMVFRISILLCCALAGRIAARVGGDNQRIALFAYAGSLLVFILIEGSGSVARNFWPTLAMWGLVLAVTLIAGLLPLRFRRGGSISR